MKNLCHLFVTCFSLVCLPSALLAFVPDSIPVYFQRQLELYPQEKIYAQIDKPDYIAGEDIWFRVYLVNAATHRPEPMSRYVYAELAGPEDGVLERVKIKIENGIFNGHLTLPEKLKEGTYSLRFYTQYMQQLGEDYFFYRTIEVGTLAKLTEEKKGKKRNKGTDFKVSFFPEGGPLPEGVVSRIGFKAIASDGLGEDIMGIVLNEKGDTISHFSSQHLGMGMFVYQPEPEGRYYAVCRNKSGLEKRFELPKAERNVLALSVNRLKENLIVSIRQNIETTSRDSYYLLGVCRGVPFYGDSWNPDKGYVAIADDILPSGILQFVLVDKNRNPVSERLFFNLNKNEQIETVLTTGKERYPAKEKVYAKLSFTDAGNNPVRGNFSVSVTHDDDVTPDNRVNILSTLLLSSDLKGYIEEPAYYFRNSQPATKEHLDLLMMTQGWSRYRVTDVLKEEYKLPSRNFEVSQSITGTVIGGLLMNKPASNYPVSLLSIRDMFSLETKTDSNGRFDFGELEFADSCNFVIQSTTPKGTTRAEILLDEFLPPTFENIVFPVREKDTLQFKMYMNKADNQLLLTKGIRTIHLSDVVVRAPRILNKGKSVYSIGMGRRYTAKQIKESSYTDLNTFLMTIPGIRVSGGDNKITTMRSGGEPLLFLNDVKMDMDFFQNILIEDVEEIEFVIGGAAAILGPAAMNLGALLITLKDGWYEEDNKEYFHIKSITPLGYQVTKEFYSPQYKPEQKYDEILPDLRTTLYWNPAIDIQKGNAIFDFFTGEEFSTYSVVIEGVTDDGKIIYSVQTIKGEK